MIIRDEFTPEELEKYPELGIEDNVFALKHIFSVINEGKNRIILTVGSTGQGKSFTNGRMAELLMVMQGKTFDTANRIFFYLKDLLHYTNKPDIERGDVSIIEELGVGMGSRQWQKNVDYSQLLQTFRDLGLITFFNVPFKAMVDKHARLLSHMQIEMCNREGNKNICKLFVLQHNPSATSEGKSTYRKYLRILTSNEWGFTVRKPIKKLYWNKPSKEFLDVYMPMQTKFKSEIRQRLEKNANKSETEQVNPMKNIQYKIERTIELSKQGIHNKDIAIKLGVSVRTIERYLKEATENDKNREK